MSDASGAQCFFAAKCEKTANNDQSSRSGGRSAGLQQGLQQTRQCRASNLHELYQVEPSGE